MTPQHIVAFVLMLTILCLIARELISFSRWVSTLRRAQGETQSRGFSSRQTLRVNRIS